MTGIRSRFPPEGLWVVFACVVFAVILVRVTWVCDDAYITFRSVENAVNGYGLTYNVGERVQAFTHPLWALLLSASYFLLFRVLRLSFPGELSLLATGLSWLMTLAAVGIVVWGARRSLAAGVLGVAVLMASKAFTDFSASGLENPLTHLLLALFLWLYARAHDAGTWRSPRSFLALSLVAGAATLNRMDTLLFFLVPLVWAWTAQPRRGRGLLLLFVGFLPFLLWEGFAVFYYGFPFPNTAYAKLSSGIASGAYLHQGLMYLLNSINLDWVTLPVVALGLMLPLATRRWRDAVVGLGIALYLVYVVRIGGDYMSGRFLSAPLLASVMLLSTARLDWGAVAPRAAIAIVTLSLLSPRSPFLSDSTYQDPYVDNKGIADDRGFRYQDWGFLRMTRNRPLPDSPFAHGRWVVTGARQPVRASGAIGLFGYVQGPNVHILDVMGLSDALLARLPAQDMNHWRIGHIERRIPAGYEQTLVTGVNLIQNPDLAIYYDRLSLVIRGDLWDWRRLPEIWNINRGAYAPLIRAYLEQP